MAPPPRWGQNLRTGLEVGSREEDEGEAGGPTEAGRQAMTGHQEAEEEHTLEAVTEELPEAVEHVEAGFI